MWAPSPTTCPQSNPLWPGVVEVIESRNAPENWVVSGGFATVHPNNKLTINALLPASSITPYSFQSQQGAFKLPFTEDHYRPCHFKHPIRSVPNNESITSPSKNMSAQPVHGYFGNRHHPKFSSTLPTLPIPPRISPPTVASTRLIAAPNFATAHLIPTIPQMII